MIQQADLLDGTDAPQPCSSEPERATTRGASRLRRGAEVGGAVAAPPLSKQPALFTGPQLNADWPFGDLAPMSYGLIMADPPWQFELYSKRGEAKSAQRHYRTMSTPEICRLPVGALAARDAVLLLWCTWPMLDAGRQVLDAWGFRYVSGGCWVKRHDSGRLAFGTGYRLRSASEPWLLGVVGEPETSRAHRNVIEGAPRRHSEKPVAAYRWAETYLPEARRLELFSRTTRPGWDAWGDEAGKFDAEVAA